MSRRPVSTREVELLSRFVDYLGKNFAVIIKITAKLPNVEVPGIEPGSSSTDTELLRA